MINIKNIFLPTGKLRKFSNKTFNGKVIYIVTILVAIYHIYANIISFPDPILIRSFHATVFVALAIYYYSPNQKNVDKISKLDYILIGLSIATFIYLLLNLDRLLNRIEFTDPVYTLDIVFGFIFIFLIFEACRRTLGWPMIIISLVLFIYTFFGQYLPGQFNHIKFSISRVIELQFITTLGIFGLITGVSATFVFMFILFGTILRVYGGGDFFFELGKKIGGLARGGAAKTAVISSALFSMISGSANANVATTGSFTIPMMKRIGYDPSFAGAVEAAASTAGTITPPVMGATAFILAQLVGIPYSKVVLLGIIPAFLYYFSIFIGVDREALRLSLKKIDDEKIKNVHITTIVIKGIPFITPLIYLVYRIFRGIPPQIAAFESSVFMILLTFLFISIRKDKNKNFINLFCEHLKDILNSLHHTTLGVIAMTVACVTASTIVGNIYLTGLGVKFSSLIMSFAHGNIFFGVFLAACLTIIFGMGVPTPAAYILAVSLAGPALAELGIPIIHAHFFVFYYAALGTITPPVCISSYMAASIAEANPMEVGLKAVILAIGGFIVPFIFIFNPELLLAGRLIEIIIILFKTMILIYMINSLFFGNFLIIKYTILEHILLMASLFLLFIRINFLNILGFSLIILIIILQLFRKSKKIV